VAENSVDIDPFCPKIDTNPDISLIFNKTQFYNISMKTTNIRSKIDSTGLQLIASLLLLETIDI